MTLTELRHIHRELFYPQDWFEGEEFMLALPIAKYDGPPKLNERGMVPRTGRQLPSAVELAHAYVKAPDAKVWENFLWTRDTDEHGQRVYVGGVTQGRTKGFQIHRHLEITELWRSPIWP